MRRYRCAGEMASHGGDPIVVVLEPDQLPMLLETGTPSAHGWVVASLAKVYKDGVAAGVFVELTIRRDGSSVLTYDEVRSPSVSAPSEP